MKKKLLGILFVILFSINIYATEDVVMETSPDIDSKSHLLIDVTSGNVLARKNADKKIFPASTTKLLTAIITLQMVDDLETMVEVPAKAFQNLPIGSSNAGLLTGEVMSVKDLLYALMLPSANEAANTLAYYIGDGSMENFVKLMNITAVKLGAYNSNFVNPTGLHDPNHYSTAYDMAIIANYAYRNEVLQEMMKTAQKTLQPTNLKPEGRKVFTTNMMIYRVSDPRYYRYSLGGKTGYTPEAGNCLISFAKKDNRLLMSLIFGTQRSENNENMVFTETKLLVEWGFNFYKNVKMLDTLAPIQEVPVTLSAENDYIALKPEKTVDGLVPINYTEEKLEYVITVPESVNAPIVKDEKIGTVEVFYDGQSYGITNLLAVNDIEMSNVLYYVDKIENFFSSTTFYMLLTILVVVVLFCALDRRQRRKRRRRKIARTKNKRYHHRQ